MPSDPPLPLPLSAIGGRYLIFSIDTAMYLRRVHRMCGTTVGSLPQAPQQNIFLGLPIELMPEEAQFLLEEGIAYLVNDAKAHDRMLASQDKARKAEYLEQIKSQGQKAAYAVREQKLTQSRNARKKRASSSNNKDSTPPQTDDNDAEPFDFDDPETPTSTSTLGPDSTPTPSANSTTTTTHSEPYAITPTTTSTLLSPPPASPPSFQSTPQIPNLPSSYPLYRHIHTHSNGYFLTPGLRFGCQYTVYPGDPLRFHSHFLAVGMEWDQGIDLMSLVGGGRLGTGVKKGFLIGGEEPRDLQVEGEREGGGEAGGEEDGGKRNNVRTFSIEWAAM